MKDHPSRYENADGLAEHWSVSRASIFRLMAEGLPSVLVGKRSRRFDIDAADKWLASRQTGAAEPVDDTEELPSDDSFHSGGDASQSRRVAI